MRIKVLFMLVLALSACFWDSFKKQDKIPSLIENDKPIYVCGGENSGRYYKFIWEYIVAEDGKVYVWDSYTGDHIDVYDGNGQFLLQFGRRGQGPGEFQALSNGAVDSKGNIWINDGNHKTLKVFSKLGEYKEDIKIPTEVARSYIRKIAINDDKLYIMCRDNRGEISIYKYDAIEERCELIYKQEERIRISFVDFVPDMTMDGAGNLYITDSFEYRVYQYTNDGILQIKYEDRRSKKERILEKDFNVFDNDFKIIRYPEYKVMLERLKGPSRYLPMIFGINIDSGKIFIWTSKRDDMNRYVVDVFDMRFNKIGKSCYFNFVRDNLAQIVGGKLYIPSIENYQVELTKHLGRLGFTNIPDRLNVYEISKEIRRR